MNMEMVTRNGLTSNGPQLITKPPSVLDHLPTTGPHYEASYIISDDQPMLSSEEANHKLHPKLSTLNSHKEPASTKPKSLPKRSCIVMGNTQYLLNPHLLSHPHMDHHFVKQRSEIKPGCFLAKLILQHQYHDKTRYSQCTVTLVHSYVYSNQLYRCEEKSDAEAAATDVQRSQAAAIVADSTVTKDEAITKRQHFPMNINRTGYVVFSVSLL